MPRLEMFAANYNDSVMWVYNDLSEWLTERGVSLNLANCATEEEVMDRAREADIYLAYRFPVTRQVIEALPQLRLLMSSGSGYDHIDVQAATDNGVVVTSTATYNVEDVAEFAILLMLACARRLWHLERAVRGEEPQEGHLVQPAHRLHGQSLGVIGFGNIGRAVAWRARGLGLRVLAYDPYVPEETMRELDVEPIDLAELLRRADFVSPHLRLNDETRHLISHGELAGMKHTAYLINTSRGGVVDEAALIKALQEGRIAGAGLDVLESEPPEPGHPLLAMDNVMVTGHAAGSTEEGIQNWLGEWKTILSDLLKGSWPINVVNPQVVPRVPLTSSGNRE